MSKEISVSITDQVRPVDANLSQLAEEKSASAHKFSSTVSSALALHEANLHLQQAQSLNEAQGIVQAASGEGATMDHKSLDETLLNSSTPESNVVKPHELIADASQQQDSACPQVAKLTSQDNAEALDSTHSLSHIASSSTQKNPQLDSTQGTQVDNALSDFDELYELQQVHTEDSCFLLDPINDLAQEKEEKTHLNSELVAGGYIDYGRASKINEARFIDPHKQYYKPWLASYPEDVPEFVDTHCYENLDDLFMTAVEAHGDHVAYVNMESSLTFNEVGDLAAAFAAFVQVNLGMKKGDKLAIMMPNIMQYPVVFFGALKAGLTVININPLYTPRELQLILDSSDATAIVVLANFAHNLQPIMDKTKLQHVIVTSIGDCLGTFKGLLVDTVLHFRGMVPHFELKHMVTLRRALRRGFRKLGDFVKPEIAYDDIALLQFTGGTTGRSKGAMISHGNLVANVAQAIGVYGSKLKGTQETILTVIPLYHIFALTVNLILMFEIGAKNLLITDPRNTKDFVKTINKHPEISALTGVNTLFNIFVNHPDFKDVKFSNLHLVIGGGAAVQSGVEQRFFERTGLHILEGYGLTECSPLCSVCPYTTDHYTGSIGLIVPSTIARIVDINGEEIHDLERTGELEIKGPQVMHGYYKCDESQNDRAFDDGFLRTGDIARWMDGGYIKLIDRLKDMILVSGFNVFPSEIEDIVSRFNRVLECAVVGVPSEKTGEAVKLFVVKKDKSLTEEEVRNYCRAYLTPYKVPAIIEFVDVLPKSALGKVLRRKLRENNTLDLPVANQPQSAESSAETDSSSVNEHLEKSQDQVTVQDSAKISSNLVTDAPKTSAQDNNAPSEIKRSAGVLALEKLLSSKSDAFGAATVTPNIHKKEEGSTKWLREDQKDKLEQEQASSDKSAPVQDLVARQTESASTLDQFSANPNSAELSASAQDQDKAV